MNGMSEPCFEIGQECDALRLRGSAAPRALRCRRPRTPAPARSPHSRYSLRMRMRSGTPPGSGAHQVAHTLTRTAFATRGRESPAAAARPSRAGHPTPPRPTPRLDAGAGASPAWASRTPATRAAASASTPSAGPRVPEPRSPRAHRLHAGSAAGGATAGGAAAGGATVGELPPAAQPSHPPRRWPAPRVRASRSAACRAAAQRRFHLGRIVAAREHEARIARALGEAAPCARRDGR